MLSYVKKFLYTNKMPIKKKTTLKFTKNIRLKLVNINDAKFIHDLRTNKILSKYLNPTSFKLDDQKKWMKQYFIRNKNDQEFYFKFQFKKQNSFYDIGVARVIKLTKKNFSFGSWIMRPGSPSWLAVECALSIYEFAFKYKKFQKNLMWMDLRNKKVIIFHKLMGAIESNRDKKQLYAYLTESNYNKIKQKLSYYFSKQIKK